MCCHIVIVSVCFCKVHMFLLTCVGGTASAGVRGGDGKSNKNDEAILLQVFIIESK